MDSALLRSKLMTNRFRALLYRNRGSVYCRTIPIRCGRWECVRRCRERRNDEHILLEDVPVRTERYAADAPYLPSDE